MPSPSQRRSGPGTTAGGIGIHHHSCATEPCASATSRPLTATTLSPRVTSPFAPLWIGEMVKRQVQSAG